MRQYEIVCANDAGRAPRKYPVLVFVFSILLMSSWAVAASVVAEQTNAEGAVFVADITTTVTPFLSDIMGFFKHGRRF